MEGTVAEQYRRKRTFMKRGGKMVRTYGLYLVLILCISFFLPRFLPGSPLSVLDEATASQNMEAFPDTFREYYAPENRNRCSSFFI